MRTYSPAGAGRTTGKSPTRPLCGPTPSSPAGAFPTTRTGLRASAGSLSPKPGAVKLGSRGYCGNPLCTRHVRDMYKPCVSHAQARLKKLSGGMAWARLVHVLCMSCTRGVPAHPRKWRSIGERVNMRPSSWVGALELGQEGCQLWAAAKSSCAANSLIRMHAQARFLGAPLLHWERRHLCRSFPAGAGQPAPPGNGE
jgi:hypothetical protein